MKVCFVTVNFNNASLTIEYVKSIVRVMPDASYKIYVIDNDSEKADKELLFNIKGMAEISYLERNIGYFPAMNTALAVIEKSEWDYIVISNNDLVLEHGFPEALESINAPSGALVIAPDIVTLDGVHQNPHEARKIAWTRMLMYSLYFSNYFLGRMMYKLQQCLKKIRNVKNRVVGAEESRRIFLGYGACYLLRPGFFSKNPVLLHPPFLMGEEVYVAYQAQEAGGYIYYCNEVKVKHCDHASCDKVPSRKMYEYSRQSFKEYRSLLKVMEDVPG